MKGTEIVRHDRSMTAESGQRSKPNGGYLVALRVEVQGRSGKRVAWQLLDYYDETTGISAMMRTTGYSLAITGVMQVDGRIRATGVHTPDEAVAFHDSVAELKRRAISVHPVTSPTLSSFSPPCSLSPRLFPP